MDTATAPDVEGAKPRQHADDYEARQARQTAAMHRAASFLSFQSVIMLAESIYRIVGVTATPEGGWGLSSDMFPPAALITGGVFQFLLALLGLLIGLGWGMYEVGHKGVTMALLGCQALLGLYVFVVFTIALPAFYIDRQVYQSSNAMSASVFGWLFTAVGYDGLLQAGQFLVALQLFQLQSGKNLTPRFFRPQLWMLSALVFLVGMSTFICGVLVRVLYYNDLYYALPSEEFPWLAAYQTTVRGVIFGVFNAIRYTPITIISGMTIMTYSPMTLSARAAPMAGGFAVFVWLWMMSAHVLSQYGTMPTNVVALVGPGLLGAEAMLTALMATVMVVVPLYFAMEGYLAGAE